MSLSCVCDCANCAAGNHVRCYYDPICHPTAAVDSKMTPEHESYLRDLYRNHKDGAVNQLFQLIDSLREELQIAWAAGNAENDEKNALGRELEAAKEEIGRLRIDDLPFWVHRAERVEKELAEVKQQLAESVVMWKGSLEAQTELERDVVELREEPAQLRKIIARQAATIHERQQAWRQMKADLEAHRHTCLCDCPHCQWCEKKSILRLPDRPVVPPRG